MTALTRSGSLKPATKKKRRSVSEVSGGIAKNWRDKLSAEDLAFVVEYKNHVNAGNIPKLPAARNLIDELDLTVSAQQVAAWFRS